MNNTKHYLRRVGKSFYVNNFHILSQSNLTLDEKVDLLLDNNPDKTLAGIKIAISCFNLINQDNSVSNHLECLSMCFNSEVLSFDYRKKAFVLFLEISKKSFLEMVWSYGNQFASMINREKVKLLD